ncbi:MAG: CopG family ribbon-helix-helix protein [Rhodothermia bacterium]|jgi:predicted transcriptional regulator
MSNTTVNLSFQEELLQRIDEIARIESRSRSELIREAARQYIDRKRQWESIFALGDLAVRDGGLRKKDVAMEITRYRKARRKTRS